MDEGSSTLGQRLRAVRLRAHMSQADLSQASGIPKPTLSRYENDHVSPSLSTLARLASALGVGAVTLLPGPLTPEEAFIETLKENGVELSSVEDARRLATAASQTLHPLAPRQAKGSGAG